MCVQRHSPRTVTVPWVPRHIESPATEESHAPGCRGEPGAGLVKRTIASLMVVLGAAVLAACGSTVHSSRARSRRRQLWVAQNSVDSATPLPLHQLQGLPPDEQ